MSEFSEHLTRIKVKNDIVISHLSDAVSVDRTTLHNYLSGKRLPPNEDFINKLAVELRLSINETDKLREEYNAARNGDDKTERYKCMESILGSYSLAKTAIPDFVNSAPRTRMSAAMPECTVITKKEKLLRVIALTFEEAFGDGADVYIIAQPSEILSSAFSSVTAHNPKSSIYHVFCFNSEVNGDDIYNLNLFRYTLLAYSNLGEYCPAYYYDRVAATKNEMSMFGNCIVTPKLVITFDSNFEYAIMYKNSDIIFTYTKLCKDRYKRCIRFLEKKTTITDFVGDFLNERESERSYYFHPCIAMSLDRNILKSVAKLPEPIKSIVTEKTISQFEKYRGHLGADSGSFVLFSEGGVEHFLNNGRITEIPDSLYNPPTPRQRIQLIERAIQDGDNDITCPRIITDENIAPSLKLGLSVFNERELVITLHCDDGCVRSASISERDVVGAVSEYLEYLYSSDRVMSKEDTVLTMKRIVESYKLTLEKEEADSETAG